MSAVKGDASRLALFPWCLGGYPGFGSEKVPNLAPCHRRFIAENAAYAVLRGIPAFYVLFSPAVRPSPPHQGRLRASDVPHKHP